MNLAKTLTLRQAAVRLGGPFTEDFLRRELRDGKLRGMGGRKGDGSRAPWFLEESELPAVVDAYRVQRPQLLEQSVPSRPSGLSSRSRTLAKAAG